MSIADTFIDYREYVLNRILNIDIRRTLNPDPCSSNPGFSSGKIANDIKDTLNRIRSLAFSTDGKHVNYQEIARGPLYRSYIDLTCELRYFDYQNLNGPDQQISFWINLYNALVIHGVIQNQIKNSVIESRLGILDFFQKNAYTINGQRFSLTDIEHGILRANQGIPYIPGYHFSSRDPRIKSVVNQIDPRIHFALNCASLSCPPIGVYTPDRIQNQLDLAARNFINNDLQVFMNTREIYISKIYQWYLPDFGGKKELLDFLEKYLENPETRQWLLENKPKVKIKFHPYDWKLNRLN